MADVLFHITCTTCEARLNVRDKSAIGAIVACPKCGSMVQVIAPPGWEEPATPVPARQAASKARGPKATASSSGTEKAPPAESNKAAGQPSPAPGAKVKPEAGGPEGGPAKEVARPQTRPQPTKPVGKKAAAASAAGVAASAIPASAEPPPAPAAPTSEAAASMPVVDQPPVEPPEALLPEAMGSQPMTQWSSPAETAMRRWLLWGAVPAAGLVMLAGAWLLLSGGNEQAPTPQLPVASAPDTDLPVVSNAALSEFEDRWVPDSPQMVLRLEIADSEAAGQLEPILRTAGPLREAIYGELFQGFGLKPNAVEQIVWSSTDLFDWSETGVVVVTLADGQTTNSLRSVGDPLEWEIEGVEFRQLNRPSWKRAFAVLDERTIVTGEEPVLRPLAERGVKPADLGSLAALLRSAPSDSDLFLALDFRAAHRAGWPLPTEWLDVWPQGRDAWRVIWNLPSAVSFSFDRDDFALAEFGFFCDSQTVADKVRAALQQWIPQAKSVLKARIAGLPAAVQAGEISADSAGQYGLALNGSLSALDSAHVEVVDQSVWLRADCGSNSPAWTAAAAGSRAAMRSDWYRAAGLIDEAAQGRLREALAGYEEAKDKAPAGAINSHLLAPDKVLSWITAMLPYLGHEPWAEDLKTSYSWNSPKNKPVTTRMLDAVQNPAVSVRVTESGYPVTHYVGVAGIGPDAADLPRDDPRAGIFGYRESRRLSDVPDGASNTIATVGVSEGLGPWASGGTATVRGFTQQPYVNGPDGFGSGQPGGMFVGMADGSARFLAADIDPTVLEQLATAAGGESVPVAVPPTEQVVRVEPKPAEPVDMEAVPEETVDIAPVPAPAPEDAPAEPTIPAVERLRRPVAGIALTNTPLCEAVRSIERYGSLLVTYDLDTMSALGVPLDQSVSTQLTESTVGEVLDTVLAACGLKAVVRQGQLWVTGAAQAQDTPRKVRYAIEDLTLPSGTTAADLASSIRRLIAPESWQAVGGGAVMQVADGALEVTQSEAVHLEILMFCEKLRHARGLSLRSRRPAEQFRLATRVAQAAPCLEQPITINFFRPTALQRIVEDIAGLCEAQIAVNWIALAEEGKSPSLPATLSLAQTPLEASLKQLLDPLGLDYRVIDARTIEITTRAAADTHFEREFYPVDELLNAGQTATALMSRLEAEVAAGSWHSKGGRGALFFDEPSRCLIVLQTQRTQAAVRQWLVSQDARTKP